MRLVRAATSAGSPPGDPPVYTAVPHYSTPTPGAAPAATSPADSGVNETPAPVSPGTPFPTSVATPAYSAAAPAAPEDTPDYYLTPQAVTGTIYVSTTGYSPLYVVPTLTSDVAGALLSVVLIYCVLWAWMRDAQRIVLGMLGCVVALVVILTASPQYTLGWLITAVGIGFAELLTSLISRRRGGRS